MIARSLPLSRAATAAETSGGYDPRWFDVLADVEERHFWFRARNDVIAAAIGALLPNFGPSPRLLEVGCGNGNVLQVLRRLGPQAQLVGMDLFDQGFPHARSRCDCTLVTGDILAPPFPAGAFELIGMFDVLEHIGDDHHALASLHSLLVPGGALVLTVPANPSLWSYFDEIAGHYRRYRDTDLIERLREAQFEVVYATHFMATVFPLLWAARRLRGRVASSSSDANRRAQNELRVRPVVNELLVRLLRWESAWIKRRRFLPVGTSLLAIARKPQSGTSPR